jgi:hypothetical protein
MTQRRQTQEKGDDGVAVDNRGINRYRACLLGGVFIYLGLACASMRWLPAESPVKWIFIFFAVHTSASLLLQEVRNRSNAEST